MRTFTKRTKGTMIVLLLCFAFICGAFALFSNTSTTAFAHEQSEVHEHDNHERGLESYSGYGCNNGVDLQVNLSGQVENNMPEFIDGFGCGSSCGASREDGFSSTYHSGCRNWQVMPIIGPMFKYWIDESTLSSLTTAQQAQFIADVDGAAAEWNSVRINDYSGAIVNLQKQSSNGIDVVPIRYNPSLSGASGKFNPIPLFHWIEIKYANNSTYSIVLHEFGHMIGLQDLDMGKDAADYSHISLMGYAGDDRLHYQDIQGLAVANYKHTTHDYRKYWRDGAWYNYVCFYCDITDSVLTSWSGGTLLADAASCLHTYERLASAGNRYWQKCPKCYKVIESEFTVNVKDGNSVEITGLIDNRTTITIPRQIGGQNVTHIGNNAFLNRGNITTITFANNSNVTSIGTSTFSGLTNLTQINFGTSPALQTIGNSAFSGCTQLSQIEIPSSVKYIGDYAFSNCVKLEYVSPLPSSLESIGEMAFNNCTVLANITIPKSVKTVGCKAFYKCPKLTIYAETISKPNGWDLNWNLEKRPVVWNCNSQKPEFTYIANGSEAIITKYNGSSDTVVVPHIVNIGGVNKTITAIADEAFANNTSLSNIILPYTLTSIGNYAFAGCSGLEFVTIPNAVESIGNYAFSNCTKMKIVYLKKSIESNSLTTVGIGTFYNCQSLDSIFVPDTASLLAYESTNWSFYELSVFTATQGLAYTYLSETDSYSVSRGNANTTGIVYIPAEYNGKPVTEFANYAFNYCENLEEIIFESGSGVTKIGAYAFSRTMLTSITLPFNVETIGVGAFYACMDLVKVKMFYNVLSIKDYAFDSCYSLEEINLSESVTSIGNYAFGNCKSLTNFAITSNVVTIGNFAFLNCGLRQIFIPDNVESIGDSAFYHCLYLDKAVFESGLNAPTLGDKLFDNCSSLWAVVLPQGLTRIGFAMFYNCYNLESLLIPPSMPSIEKLAFNGCHKLTLYVNASNNMILHYGWDPEWNCGRPVVWNCLLSADGSYVTSTTRNQKSISLPNITTSAPYREGYLFGGWEVELLDGSVLYYHASELYSVPDDTKIKANWFSI